MAKRPPQAWLWSQSARNSQINERPILGARKPVANDCLWVFEVPIGAGVSGTEMLVQRVSCG